MTLSNADVPAEELAALAADRPVLVGRNALSRPTTPALWRDSSLSMAFASFEDAGGGRGAYLVHSGGAAVRARPVNLGLTTWHLLFELSGEFDCFALINHNLADVPSISCRVLVSDSSTFGATSTILAAFSPDPVRHVTWDVGDDSTPQRFSGTGYGAFEMTAPAGFWPEIGALWLGRRRQLQRGPDVPHDDRARGSRVLGGSPDASGFEVVEALHTGRRRLRAAFTADDTDASLRDLDTVRAWWADCRQGSAPFLYARAPVSAPGDVGLYLARGGLTIPEVGAEVRRWELEADELPPFLAAEGL